MNRNERRRQKRATRTKRRVDPAARGLLRQAKAAMEAGDLETAEKEFRRLTRRDPLNAEPFHMLALIAYEKGHLEEAGEMILEAITRNDTDVAMHANCGAIMNLLGRPQEAEAACRHVIDMAPDQAEAHNNLAVALEVQGRLEEALEAGARAIELDPDYAEAHINLGNVNVRAGNIAAAVDSFRRATVLAPANPLAHANLGVALREAGGLDAAEAACRRAIDLNKDFAVGHNSLGNVLKAKGDLEAAEKAYGAALQLRPGYQDARLNLAAALFQGGDPEGAEAAYEEALARNPDLAEAHAGLGVVLLAAGRLEDAVERFRKAVEANPAHGDAQYNLAAAAGAEIGDEETAEIARLADSEHVPAADRVKLRFALAEIADTKGDPEAAFAEMEAGNAARKALLEKAGKGFDADAHDSRVDRIIAAFGPDWLAGRRARGEATDQPVFIVGLPRSGTTLVEQIAASHPAVVGRGETDTVRILAGDDPATAAAMEDEALDALAADVLARLRGRGGRAEGAARIAEKTPFNFLYLGLIQGLFPNARVVHCVRDPMDVGFSCYRQNFTAPHAWACDLGDIGRYARAHDRLMAHWRDVLSLPMLAVRYEDLVKDQEGESRRLVDFLGLDWDAACLEFHKTGRAVLTASNWQVRKPLYASAVGRAEAFAKFLKPLKKALDGG